MTTELLGAFGVALVVSAVACAVALALFPWFRSGEHKVDVYRTGQSTSGATIARPQHGKRQRRVRISTAELPLVGGAAMLVGVLVACLGLALFLGFDLEQWKLLGILLVAMLGFGLVGLIDDVLKYWRGNGISEWQKFAGVIVVSGSAGVALNRLIYAGRFSARFAYPPYSVAPGLGNLLVHVHFAWIIFFLGMTVVVASSTSLATDFADGMDGLCGGLLVSASLAFAVILLNDGQPDLYPLILVSLGVAGAAFGFLPFNWPSSWKPRNQGNGKRRARLIMGDTGSLALGGVLALVAIMSRNELLLIIIGGVFLLEGVSALVTARILVKFFRLFLVLERFNSSKGFAHSEFPLPFLGTPMHHHFDLLNWDRKRLVYGAWLLGAVLGLLGVASVVGTYTWERYLARLAGLVVILSVWQLGPRTRSFFIGLTGPKEGPAGQLPRLALYYGYPFKLFGRRLGGRVDVTRMSVDVLETAGERLTLWQRMSVFDARALLGYYCFREEDYEDALRIWERIPDANLQQRPEIEGMLAEVRHALALALAGASDESESPPAAALAESGPHTVAVLSDDPATTQLHMQSPSAGGTNAHQPEPEVQNDTASRPVAAERAHFLWNATSWSAATSGIMPLAAQDAASGHMPFAPEDSAKTTDSGETPE
jgi:UDP-N-acetylmuramyl pentapeptide phosphotransferase/UDP-N-acetylglucosamine-1-phosphate transferase